MPELLARVFATTGAWELVAVALAIAYLLFAIRQSLWCWPAALVSSLIYIRLMYDAALYMESLLQVFYAVLALYGWWAWQYGGRDAAGDAVPLAVATRPFAWHATLIVGLLSLSLLSGWLLGEYSAAAMPFLDSLTTWGAIGATWMVARKLLENWYYWFVIDSLSIWLYVSRGLVLTALLFAVYLVLIVVGLRAWRRAMAQPA